MGHSDTDSSIFKTPPPPPVDSIWAVMLVWRLREDNQNCSVLCGVRQLCTMIPTQMWAVLAVLWIGFYRAGFISLCIDLFVYLCVVCFFVFCCICVSIVSVVGWTWRDWSLILRTKLPSVLWHCWLGHLTCKNPSPLWPIMCLVER